MDNIDVLCPCSVRGDLMNELLQLLVGDLTLAPEYMFLARLVILSLCVETVGTGLAFVACVAKIK